LHPGDVRNILCEKRPRMELKSRQDGPHLYMLRISKMALEQLFNVMSDRNDSGQSLCLPVDVTHMIGPQNYVVIELES
jgi:hypothetical protein